jgi:hypothetical protein
MSPFFETAKNLLNKDGKIIMGYVTRDTGLNSLLHKTAEKIGFQCKNIELKEFYGEEEIPSSEFVPKESLQLLLFNL